MTSLILGCCPNLLLCLQINSLSLLCCLGHIWCFFLFVLPQAFLLHTTTAIASPSHICWLQIRPCCLPCSTSNNKNNRGCRGKVRKPIFLPCYVLYFTKITSLMILLLFISHAAVKIWRCSCSVISKKYHLGLPAFGEKTFIFPF